MAPWSHGRFSTSPSVSIKPQPSSSLPTPSSLPPLGSLSLVVRRREVRRRIVRAAPRRSPTGCQTPADTVPSSSSDSPRPSIVHRSSARACASYAVRHPWSLAGVRAPLSKRLARITPSAVDAIAQHTNWTIHAQLRASSAPSSLVLGRASSHCDQISPCTTRLKTNQTFLTSKSCFKLIHEFGNYSLWFGIHMCKQLILSVCAMN
jgi:hypothetical protein